MRRALIVACLLPSGAAARALATLLTGRAIPASPDRSVSNA